MRGELVEERKLRRGMRKCGVKDWLKKAWEGGKGSRMMEKGSGVDIGIERRKEKRAEERDRRAGSRRAGETDGEKSSPTARAEMELRKGKIRRKAQAEAEEGEETKANRRELGTATRTRTPVALRAARRESGGLERRTWVMRWETRKRARSAWGSRPDTSSPITTPTKGGSAPLAPLLSLWIAAAAVEIEREE